MRYLIATLVIATGCSGGSSDAPDFEAPVAPSADDDVASAGSDVSINPRLLRRFRSLQKPASLDPVTTARVALGKQLFFDKRLSRDKNTSCNSCHALDRGGADTRPVSIGTAGQRGARNAPSVFNASRHIAQFWDGRAGSLEQQARGPLTNSKEMAMEPSAITATLRDIPGYASAFAAAFPEDATPIDFDHATRAIAEFERTLATPSRWDRFLDGDKKALSAAEIEGLKVFADVGCVQCHTGELIGGSMFQRTGLVVPWPNQSDLGRYEITGAEADRMMFKVPSLRNVALTGPYFHDGSIANLDDAIRMMAKHQIGESISDEDVEAIRVWLGSLTGEPPKDAITPPVLPGDRVASAEAP